MVGVLEAGLVVGALGLDIYAYKKMKDAEAAADAAVRDRERTRFKTEAAHVQVEVHPEPVAAGTSDTHTQTALADHGTDEHATTHTEWKPVTYESVAPVEAHEETITTVTTTSVDADEIKKQYQTIAERLDVIDERLQDQDSKISVMDTKFEHAESEVEKSTQQFQSTSEQWRQVDERLQTIDERLENVEIPAEQIEAIVDKRFTKTNDKLAGSVKQNSKKLDELSAKLDSYVISAADPALIKRDLRDEFYPLLKAPQTALEAHEKENKAAFAALSKRITQARDAALAESRTKASKADVRRIIATIKARPVAKAVRKVRTVTVKKTVKAPAARAPFGPSKKTVKTTKVTKKTKTVKKTKAASRPKSKIQSAVHEFAKSRKTKKTSKSATTGEVTVTTSVPKGVNVSTEVVTGGKQ